MNDNIEEIKDIIYLNEDIFFVGRVRDNVDSLYKITGGITKRLVYDFPVKVDTEKGIESDESNNILFIGSNDPNEGKEQIYKYSQDSSISSISDTSYDYSFVEYIK